jgi:integrase
MDRMGQVWTKADSFVKSKSTIVKHCLKNPPGMLPQQASTGRGPAEIDKVLLHDLRHTFGSIKVDQGKNLQYVKDQMGHSSIQTTEDIYGHKLKEQNREAAARTDQVVFGRN